MCSPYSFLRCISFSTKKYFFPNILTMTGAKSQKQTEFIDISKASLGLK